MLYSQDNCINKVWTAGASIKTLRRGKIIFQVETFGKKNKKKTNESTLDSKIPFSPDGIIHVGRKTGRGGENIFVWGMPSALSGALTAWVGQLNFMVIGDF